MSAFSDYLENTLINATLRGATYTGGAVYVALFTTDPTDAGTGAELLDSAYVRQRAHTTVASDGFTVPANGVTSNARNIVFPAIVDGQVTVTHWALFDAQTAGNMLYHAPMLNEKTLDPTDVISFPIGSLSITLA
ncbi:phage tail fiber protein [Ectopseudomonas khazarica]|uniref:phage tail fiber protein n=1 Tax=Ectopseudomonas khazarica TaxID=2502979 RepID=UPI004033D0A3